MRWAAPADGSTGVKGPHRRRPMSRCLLALCISLGALLARPWCSRPPLRPARARSPSSTPAQRISADWKSPRAPTATCGSPSGWRDTSIGRITPSGQITEFPLPSDVKRPEGISPPAPMATSGSPRGARTRIGRITPSGQITEFPVPGAEQRTGEHRRRLRRQPLVRR